MLADEDDVIFLSCQRTWELTCSEAIVGRIKRGKRPAREDGTFQGE